MQQKYGFYTIYSMKELIHFSATIFVESPIGYTKDNVDMFPLKDWKCMPLTNDANTQAINPFEIISSSKDFDGAEWKAVNLEKGLVIVFLGKKIDILGQPFVDGHSFVQISKQIFDQVCAGYNVKKIVRFAYSPTYGEKNGDFSDILRHPSYKDSDAENLTKISAAMGSIEVKDVWMRHRSDEQMQYIFKLTDHLSLEIMSPLMKESEGEFYSVYYDGECQHMGAATINNIADEMKKLKDYLKE